MKYEDNNDDSLREELEFHESDLFTVLDTMKNSSDMLLTCDTEFLCEEYKTLFPPKDGIMFISFEKLEKLNSHIINITLWDLVKDGLVEMSWSDESNDFVFSAKNSSGDPQ